MDWKQHYTIKQVGTKFFIMDKYDQHLSANLNGEESAPAFPTYDEAALVADHIVRCAIEILEKVYAPLLKQK